MIQERKSFEALKFLLDNSTLPRYKKELDEMREELLKWIKRTNTPALEAFENRDSPSALKKIYG